MTNSRRIVFALLASLTLATAVWALPPSFAVGRTHLSLAAAAQQKTTMVSGKISSIQIAGKGAIQDGFTLDITEDQTISLFMVPQTKVTGELKVGAKADVTYVFDNDGNKVAVTVKVS